MPLWRANLASMTWLFCIKWFIRFDLWLSFWYFVVSVMRKICLYCFFLFFLCCCDLWQWCKDVGLWYVPRIQLEFHAPANLFKAHSIIDCLDFSCVPLVLRHCHLHERGMTHIVRLQQMQTKVWRCQRWSVHAMRGFTWRWNRRFTMVHTGYSLSDKKRSRKKDEKCIMCMVHFAMRSAGIRGITG